MQQSRTTTYNPMGNGMVERFNQTLVCMIGTLDDKQKEGWTSLVSSIIHAYNATKHDSTGYTPFYLMFGRHPLTAFSACTSVSFSVCWKEYQTIYSPSFCFFNHYDFIKFIKEQLKNILIFRFKLCEFIICKNTQKFTKHSVSTVIHVLVYTMHWGSAYVLCATSGTMLWTVCRCVCPPG